MRGLFFALVLANVAFFGWAHWVDTPEIAAAPSDQDKGVPTLALASNSTTHAGAPQRCRTLGPFPDLSSAQAATAALRAHGITARNRSVERSTEDGYWVYINDVGGVAEQHRVLSLLQKGGISDASLMTDAEDTGRISVGIFSEQARAVRRAEQVRALGFRPVLDLHQRAQRAFWLDMELHPDQPEPPLTTLQSVGGDAGTGSVARSLAFGDCPLSDKPG